MTAAAPALSTVAPPRAPSGTSLRFATLVVLAVSVTAFVYAYVSNGGFSGIVSRSSACNVRANLYPTTSGVPDPDAGKWAVYRACVSGLLLPTVVWIAAGLLVLSTVAALVYLLSPWWRIRRSRLCRIEDRPEVWEMLREPLQDATVVAGLRRRPEFYLDLTGPRAGGVAFGTRRRPRVCLDAGLIALFHQDRAGFDAIVLHELAHVRTGDIPLTYLTIAVWRACVAVAVLPWVLIPLLPPARFYPKIPLWSHFNPLSWFNARLYGGVLVLAALILLVRNAVLRSREREADALVARWTGSDDPYRSLASGRPHRRILRWIATHPTAAARRAALREPASLLRPGALEAFATGLALQVGYQHLLSVLRMVGWYHADNGSFDVMRVVWGVLFALPVGVIAWRGAAFRRAGGRARMLFAAPGLALGAGIAVGDLVALEQVPVAVTSLGVLRTAALAFAPTLMLLVCAWAGRCALLLGPHVSTGRGLLFAGVLGLLCIGLFGHVDTYASADVNWTEVLRPYLDHAARYGRPVDRPVVQAAVLALLGNLHPAPPVTAAALAALWLVPLLLAPRSGPVVRAATTGAGFALVVWLAALPVFRLLVPGGGPERAIVLSAWELTAAVTAQLVLSAVLRRRHGWVAAACGTWVLGSAVTLTMWLAHWHGGQVDSILARRPLQILATTGIIAAVLAIAVPARRPTAERGVRETGSGAARRRNPLVPAMLVLCAASVATIVWCPASLSGAPIQPPPGPPPVMDRNQALSVWSSGGGSSRLDDVVWANAEFVEAARTHDPARVLAACRHQLQTVEAAAHFPAPPVAEVSTMLSSALHHLTIEANWCVRLSLDPAGDEEMPETFGRGAEHLLRTTEALFAARMALLKGV
ncbi:M48 family metalloprotease [Catenuloplanes japonicus]|uniref:M48 family metalloprotease n=1 Tax=Catenuloplanes japonicus TaxID=33876 RepID=UPI0005251139|nr:M48 family metalloprotease [Catenuloplanes japonicus]